MTTVAIGSVRGAPGVTTTSLLVASALGDAVLVEADLNGGALALRFGLGREPGLTTLVADRSMATGGWRDHAQSAGGVPVLVGPDGPESSRALWSAAGERIAAQTDALEVGFKVVDLGRLGGPHPILGVADRLVVLVRPVAEHLVGLNHRLAGLRAATRGSVDVVLVGDGPYRPGDLEPWGLEVIASLPDDARAARALCDGGSASSVRRSLLARSAMALAATLGPRNPIGARR